MKKHTHKYVTGESGTIAVCNQCSRFKHVGSGTPIVGIPNRPKLTWSEGEYNEQGDAMHSDQCRQGTSSKCICPTATPKHTPTPWHRNVSPAWKYPIYADRNGDANGNDWIHIGAVLSKNPNAEADLDFIVRAVNAYEKDQETIVELLASLREYKEAAVNGSVVTIGMARRSAAAIAKAEGKGE